MSAWLLGPRRRSQGQTDDRVNTGGDRLPKVKVTLQCTAPGRGKTFCWLVVGCLNDDSLLISRHINVASLSGPMELTAMLRSKLTGDLRVVAAVLSDKVIGGDTVTPVTYTISQQVALRQARPAQPPAGLAVQHSCASGAQEGIDSRHYCILAALHTFSLSFVASCNHCQSCRRMCSSQFWSRRAANLPYHQADNGKHVT